MPSNKRKRLVGGGKKVSSSILEFEVFQWLMDTVWNLVQRVNSTMLLHKAFMTKLDLDPQYNISNK